MLEKLLENKRIVIIAAAVILTIIVLAGFFFGNDDSGKKTVTTTTTTTLPDKKAPACEFLTEEALAAGGIVPDVEPKTTDKEKRCTYTDIGGTVNFITLYVDTIDKCPVLIAGMSDIKALDEVAKGAKYSEETDPTIIVPLENRCFFVQGSKTIVTKATLTQIATAVTQTFKAVDATTTTTTPTTVIVPETQLTLPGQNTAVTTTTTTVKKD